MRGGRAGPVLRRRFGVPSTDPSTRSRRPVGCVARRSPGDRDRAGRPRPSERRRRPLIKMEETLWTGVRERPTTRVNRRPPSRSGAGVRSRKVFTGQRSRVTGEDPRDPAPADRSTPAAAPLSVSCPRLVMLAPAATSPSPPLLLSKTRPHHHMSAVAVVGAGPPTRTVTSVPAATRAMSAAGECSPGLCVAKGDGLMDDDAGGEAHGSSDCHSG